MSKNVSLTVHKNTVASRNKREMAKDASRTVESMIREGDVRAYAFIGIKADGEAMATWDTGGVIPMWCFPEAIHAILDADMRSSGVIEDFVAPITGGMFKRFSK